jgi:hypothetical protein
LDSSKLAVHEAYCLLYISQIHLFYLNFRLFWLQFIHNVVGIFLGNGHVFGMTAPCNNLIVLVDELNGCESKRLANWSPQVIRPKRELAETRCSNLHLSQTTSPLMRSPTLPPELRYATFRSVDTPVEKSPRDARASEPPKSTIEAMVPP